jgi:hypothetical protein
MSRAEKTAILKYIPPAKKAKAKGGRRSKTPMIRFKMS